MSTLIASLPGMLFNPLFIDPSKIAGPDSFSGVSLMLNILTGWISLCFFGGIMKICRESDQGAEFRFNMLFEGFHPKKSGKFMQLLLWCFLFLLGILLATVIPLSFISQGNAPAGQVGVLSALFFIIVLPILFIFSMLFWLTTPLIMLEDMKPLNAIKTSFAACRRNIPALLVYGLLWIGIGIALWLLFLLIALLSIPLFQSGAVSLDWLPAAFGNNIYFSIFAFFIIAIAFSSIFYTAAYLGIYTSYRSIFPKGYLNKH